MTDEIELYGHRFRLHRITGLAAFKAKAEWAGVVGETGAHILALSAERVVDLAQRAMTPNQRKVFEDLGPAEAHRALALLAIVQCMRRDRMTGEDMLRLVDAFILGHVELGVGVVDGVTQWRTVKATDDLDQRLDGSHDGDVWNDLLWRQIPHCLGPTIAIDGTSPDTPPMAQT